MSEDSGNYITSWYENMRLLKWQKVLHTDKYFKNLDCIKKELEAFFDPSDFNKNSKINPDNWLLHVLANQQLNSIYVLNETAELLKYQKNIPDAHRYRLKNNEGKVNYKEFQEKLYEIYIHYILNSSGLLSEIGRSYKSEKGFDKEIDILLKFENCYYNVEITKYYDGFKEELLSLATTILEILRNTTFKRAMYLHEMFTGYFAFKTRNATILRKNKDSFETRIKALLHGYRAGGDVISYPAKIVNKNYEFDLEPAFNKNFEKNYKEMLKGYPASIRFGMTGDLKNNEFHVEANVELTESITDTNLRLIEKIKTKLQQHKDCPYKLIIVIGIEELFSSHEKSRAIPIRKKDVDDKAIHAILKRRAIVWLIFKEFKPGGVTYESMVMGNTDYDNDLLNKINSINPVVIYNTKINGLN